MKERESVFSISPQTNYWRGEDLTDEVFSSAIDFDISDSEIIQRFAVDKLKNTLNESLKETVYGSGAVLLVDRQKFEELGMFNELYSPAYYEDSDLCLSAWRRGWSSWYTSKTVAWHKISATSEKVDSNFKNNLMLRNFYIFNIIHMDSVSKLVKFLKNSLCFSLVKLFDGDKEGKVLSYFLKKSGELLQARETLKAKNKLSIEDVLERTKIKDKCYESPKALIYNFKDVYQAILRIDL